MERISEGLLNLKKINEKILVLRNQQKTYSSRVKNIKRELNGEKYQGLVIKSFVLTFMTLIMTAIFIINPNDEFSLLPLLYMLLSMTPTALAIISLEIFKKINLKKYERITRKERDYMNKISELERFIYSDMKANYNAYFYEIRLLKNTQDITTLIGKKNIKYIIKLKSEEIDKMEDDLSVMDDIYNKELYLKEKIEIRSNVALLENI